MRRIAVNLFRIFLILTGAFLGWQAGTQSVELVRGGLLRSWKSFPLPQEQHAAHFVDAEGPQLVIETQEGRRLRLSLSSFQDPVWDMVEEPSTGLSGSGECRGAGPYWDGLIVRPLLVQVVERRYCWYAPHAEVMDHLVFGIDSSGGIYRWHLPDFGYGILFWIPVCGGAGILLGGLLGNIVFGFMHRKWIQQRQPAVTKDRWPR